MAPTLVISDANVLIDMECGDLVATMFELDYRFAVPDVLYEMELREHHPDLIALGLQVMELSSESVGYVETLAADRRAKGVGRYDLFALALARQQDCLLLTGDALMRALARAEGRRVHGTLWLVGELLAAGRIRLPRARRSYAAMRRAGRRLPWTDVAEQLERFKRADR